VKERPLVDYDDVPPALLGEVKCRAASHDSGADDD
jgi:hypothetical protein